MTLSSAAQLVCQLIEAVCREIERCVSLRVRLITEACPAPELVRAPHERRPETGLCRSPQVVLVRRCHHHLSGFKTEQLGGLCV